MRVELRVCDYAKCDKQVPNVSPDTDGWTTPTFDGRIFDFCGRKHEDAFGAEVKRLAKGAK